MYITQVQAVWDAAWIDYKTTLATAHAEFETAIALARDTSDAAAYYAARAAFKTTVATARKAYFAAVAPTRAAYDAAREVYDVTD